MRIILNFVVLKTINAHLDYLVAERCNIRWNDKLYTVPAGNNVNWLSLVSSILCMMGIRKIGTIQPITMDRVIETVENGITSKWISRYLSWKFSRCLKEWNDCQM